MVVLFYFFSWGRPSKLFIADFKFSLSILHGLQCQNCSDGADAICLCGLAHHAIIFPPYSLSVIQLCLQYKNACFFTLFVFDFGNISIVLILNLLPCVPVFRTLYEWCSPKSQHQTLHCAHNSSHILALVWQKSVYLFFFILSQARHRIQFLIIHEFQLRQSQEVIEATSSSNMKWNTL